MSEPNVLLEQDGAVARLTLNRPKAHNTMNLAFMSDFRDAVVEVGKSDARMVSVTLRSMSRIAEEGSSSSALTLVFRAPIWFSSSRMFWAPEPEAA